MKNNTSKMNTTTILVLIIAALPILLFSLTRMFPPTADAETGKKAVSEAEANRLSASERRAQRAEARKAKKAEKAATATAQQGMMPDPGMGFPPPMEPMDFGGFGPGMGFDNGMAMAPGMGGGFGGGFGGPGMGFGGGFGGPF